jgi:dTDP-glucose pyrophosphorylase
MLNVVIPMAGHSLFYPETLFKFPKPFQEIIGKTMIQQVIEYLDTITVKKKFIFIINKSDVEKFQLDSVLKLLTNYNCEIVIQQTTTRGAVCSLLLAMKHLNINDSLLISNADQILIHDINKILDYFCNLRADGGVVCFESIHPHWSYAKTTNHFELLEVAEKKPISKNAIAGLYYFNSGKDFIKSAMKTIIKDRNLEGNYYISLVLNEMILDNKKILSYNLAKDEYWSFYSPDKIIEYESFMKSIIKND